MSPRPLDLTLSLLFATAIAAQGMPSPGPEHQKLARLTGTWDAVIETPGHEGRPAKSHGVSEMRLGLGGFWLIEDFTGDFGGMKFQGHGLLGFDPCKRKHVHTWVDSMSPMPMVSEGTYDQDGKTLTMVGTGTGMDGKPTQVRSVFTWKDVNTAVSEISMSGPEGKEVSKLQITYARRQAGTKVGAIQRIVADLLSADYRGDLEGLTRGLEALAAHADEAPLANSVRYWRGFALWRLALNRMTAPDYDRALAQRELRDAAAAFLAVTAGGLVADAKSAAAGCLMSVLYLAGPKDPEAQALVRQFQKLMEEAVAAAPENPRVLWVRGGQQLWTPAQFGGSRSLAIGTYERGLAAARTSAPAPADPLAPGWGEPEALMSLAYACANFEPFDLARAEAHAREALALQPEWHYVRDVLLPGIQAKRGGK